ncbi:Uncharacterised protein [Mycobacterium tuberculosis]|nr:Uncharacterised protein [Mycobacterium tuberculosis]
MAATGCQYTPSAVTVTSGTSDSRVSEDGGGQLLHTGRDDRVDVGQQERLTAGEEQFAHSPARRFTDDSADPLRPQFAMRGAW